MNEAAYNSKVAKKLRGEGAFVAKIHGQAMQVAGLPDLYVASGEFHGWLEGKVGRRPATPLQRAIARKLIARGIPAFVLRGPDNLLESFDGDAIGRLPSGEPWLPLLATNAITCR